MKHSANRIRLGLELALADQFTAKVKSILENWTEEVM